MDGPSDRELLAGWKAGDSDAGNELVRRHFDALYCFFRTKVDAGHEDLIQSTFLACVRSHHQFRGESTFRTFLFAIAKNELYRSFRGKKREFLAFDPEQISLRDVAPGPSTVVTEKEEQRLLLEALRRIPLELQITLELHYWEGMSTRELAEVLDIPQGTVKSRLRRGREALEEALAEIASNSEQLQNTMTNLEVWAKSIRALVGNEREGE